MTDLQRREEIDYFYEMMLQCSSVIEANLSRRDTEMSKLYYRIYHCLYLLLLESRKNSRRSDT